MAARGRIGAAGVAACWATVALLQPPTGWASSSEPSQEERIEALESQVEVLAEELSRERTRSGVPEERELESAHGLGPAASKVYFRESGLSIGGYGEVRLQTQVTSENDGEGGTRSPNDIFDALRAVLYVGYKFNDRILVNSEIELEHAGTGGGGSVSAEFLTVDFFLTESLALRAGLLLIPMGFINEIHEPTFYFGAERPEVERQIIPSTWRENGAGVFGEVAERLKFRIYAVNGFQGSGFSVAGLRGGRQKGSRALANHWAFVARADFEAIDGLTLAVRSTPGIRGSRRRSRAR